MKIKYEFANETVTIEVEDQWATVLVDLDREEYNDNHRETRRHCSLDALNLDATYPSNLGYGYKDMDGNGTPEMFLMSQYLSIHAVFTLSEGEPVLLEAVYKNDTGGYSAFSFASLKIRSERSSRRSCLASSFFLSSSISFL